MMECSGDMWLGYTLGLLTCAALWCVVEMVRKGPQDENE